MGEDNGEAQQEDAIWRFRFLKSAAALALFLAVLVLFPACLDTIDGDSGLEAHSRVAPQLAGNGSADSVAAET